MTDVCFLIGSHQLLRVTSCDSLPEETGAHVQKIESTWTTNQQVMGSLSAGFSSTSCLRAGSVYVCAAPLGGFCLRVWMWPGRRLRGDPQLVWPVNASPGGAGKCCRDLLPLQLDPRLADHRHDEQKFISKKFPSSPWGQNVSCSVQGSERVERSQLL